jgi:hypothetical protein
MPTIIALNPRKKGKKKKGKKKRKRPAMTALQKKYFGKKAERKGPTKMAKAKKKTTKKRYNPKKKKGGGGGSRRGGAIASTIFGAAKSTVPLLFGALTAKFFAKKFAEGGAESDNWNWKNYALAGGSTVGAAFLVGALFRKKAITQKVLEGGLLLLAYKLFTNEIAPMNQYTESWFGGAEDEFDPYGAIDQGEEGDIWEGDNEDYVKGVDGYWRPASEAHRQPIGNLRDVMVNPDPRYGGYRDVMVNPDPRYGGYGITVSEVTAKVARDGM